jgi:[ribosomal protein S5]-alanine N-acetyltransferase
MIRTARLILRRARPDDLADVFAMMSQATAMRYWSTPEHATVEHSRIWLAAMMVESPDSDDFLIEYIGRVIGNAGSGKLPEIGYLLHPDFWDQGLAHEAMVAVIAHLFASHPVPALTAEVDPRNHASLRLLSRLGFVETGRASRTLQWRDEWCDSVYFALPRPIAIG